MKKTIAISVSMLFCVAITMMGISFVQQKQWTKPQTDEMNIFVNSPVEDVQQQYKEYKWDYMYNYPESKITEENWNTSGVELTDDMISFDEAGYKACEMMDTALPQYNIEDNIFYGFITHTRGFKTGADVYRFMDSASWDDGFIINRSCDIDIYTGKCVQAIAGEEIIYNTEQFGPYKKYKELTQQQTNEILEYAVEKCSAFGYSDFVSYKITEVPGFKSAKYWVYIYTEKDELIRASLLYTDTKIYFEDFCNEKMLGYGLDITELPNVIPDGVI